MIKNLFLGAYNEYLNHMRTVIPNYDMSIGHEIRRKQCQTLINSINDDFDFDKIVVLETGASANYWDGLFGLFLGFIAVKKENKMISVDISKDVVDKSNEIFNNVIPQLDYSSYVKDSVQFLKDNDEIPNLVHLDSWDFNLFDPFPSALHGWEEFKAIESKMSKGSIIIIDDNYRKDTYVQWFHADGREEHMAVPYPMVGKGAHIFQHVLNTNSNWKLIGNHYDTFDNIKIIIQKR
jgi:hypothetical protein